jgi:hypothetical protein
MLVFVVVVVVLVVVVVVVVMIETAEQHCALPALSLLPVQQVTIVPCRSPG